MAPVPIVQSFSAETLPRTDSSRITSSPVARHESSLGSSRPTRRKLDDPSRREDNPTIHFWIKPKRGRERLDDGDEAGKLRSSSTVRPTNIPNMNMQHPRAMVDPAQRFVTWTYPETFPSIPFFLVYHPCVCGHEVTVEAVTVQSYLERGLQALQLREESNDIANRALADHLAQNYWYPPTADRAYEDDLRDENEGGADYHRHNETNPRTNHSRPLPRDWLVYPEYEPDNENIENRRGSAATPEDDCPIGRDDSNGYDDESDEAER